jgi:hypothetical protein
MDTRALIWSSIGERSAAPLLSLPGQALFVNSFRLSLAVQLNSLLLPAELDADWTKLRYSKPGDGLKETEEV